MKKICRPLAVVGAILWSATIFLRETSLMNYSIIKHFLWIAPNIAALWIGVGLTVELYPYIFKKDFNPKYFYAIIEIILAVLLLSEIIHCFFLDSSFDIWDMAASIAASIIVIIVHKVVFMSKTDKSRIAYNKKAYDYENTADGRFTRPLRRLIINTVNVADGQRVLDVACGTGDLIASLAKKAAIHAYGIDIAEQMIEVARRENKNITYSVSPAYPLPFRDSAMDIITVSAAFHHFEEPQRFANECMRVLCSGGSLYIGEFSYPPIIRHIFNAFLPLLNSGDVRIYSKKELAGFFSNAGFKNVGITGSDRCKVFLFEKS